MENEISLELVHPQNYDELMFNCRSILKERVDEIVNINLPFLETSQGRIIMEEQLYGLMLQMLSYIQANAKTARKARQREGIIAAKERGVHIGRKPKYNADDYIDIFKKVENGETDRITARDEMGVCDATYFKMKRELKKKGLL